MKTPRDKLLEILPKNSIAAEVGVWKGNFSKVILDRCIPQMLYLVDPWLWDNGSGANRTCYIANTKVAQEQSGMDALHDGVVTRFGSRKNVTIIRDKSVVVAKKFLSEGQQLDWAYIDGSHDYKSVIDDLNAWSKIVKAGGLLAGDDYAWGSKEFKQPVKRAIDAFLKTHDNYIKLQIIDNSQFILKRIK